MTAEDLGWPFSRTVTSRFFKYAYLAFLLAVTLKIVFDGFSYYYARRSLDDELASRKISSLEYLTVLSQRNRAIVLASLETRCVERNELAAIRAIEAKETFGLEEAYKASFQVKNAIVDYLQHSTDPNVASKINIERLTADVNSPRFLVTNLEHSIQPANGINPASPEFKAASQALLAALRDNFRLELGRLAAYADKLKDIQDKFGLHGRVLEHVALLEQRMTRLNQEKEKLKLTDMADILARYSIWTNAIAGGENDSPILDEMAYRLDEDNAESLLKLDCKPLEKYYSKVTGVPFAVKDQVDDVKSASLVGYYRSALLEYFRIPPIAQTLYVTLFLGALGALTINVLRLSRVGWWAEQSDPLWGEVVLSPFLGALAAFGIFMLGSAGMLLTGDAKGSAGGAVALSAFFIGTLGFVSGLLYDAAFGRVRRFGLQLFGADEKPMGPTEADLSLADTLRSAGHPLAAELALKTALGTMVAPLSEFTILMRSDDSWASASVAEWTELTGSVPSPKLNEWYRRHIAGKRLQSSDALGSSAGGTVTELLMQDGTKLNVGFAIDGLAIGGVKVVKADLVWGNGVVQLLAADVAQPAAPPAVPQSAPTGG